MQHHTMQHLDSSNGSMTIPILPERLAAGIILGLCTALGVPCNIAIMVRLIEWLKGDSFTPRLMLSLAVSDLLCLIPLPLCVYAVLFDWIFGTFLCKLVTFMVYLGIYSSNLCMVLLSVQRYMQVLHPQKWAQLKGRGRKSLLSGIWILSGMLASGAVIHRDVNVENTVQVACSQRYWTVAMRLVTLLWEAVFPLVSIFILAFLYLRLYQRVNQSIFSKRNTLAKVVTRIVVTFFIVWIPFVITKLIFISAHWLSSPSLLHFAAALNRITSVLPFINGCVNPFLYGFTALALQRQAGGTQNG